MQNDPLSHGLWEATAPPAPPTSPLDGRVKADVAVVGCGYTGLVGGAQTRGSRRQGRRARGGRDRLRRGRPQCRLVNAGMWVMPSEMPKALGPDYGERALRLLGDAPARRLGDDREARDRLRSGAQRHVAVRRRRSGLPRSRSGRGNGARAARRCACCRAAETAERTGSEAYAGALLDMRAGTIQPLAYARGLARAAIAAGAADPHPEPGSRRRADRRRTGR